MNQISSYPAEMAKVLAKQWSLRGFAEELLPDPPALTTLLDVSYQASLLREEDDPVRCRIIYATPAELRSCLTDETRPHTLGFDESVPMTPHNLRKLSGAADFYRALLAVNKDDDEKLSIWGMVVTGTEWVNRVEGSRFEGVQLPPHLVVQAVRPGHLVAASGYSRVLETTQGQLLTDGFDPFRSSWIGERFADVRESLLKSLPEPKRDVPMPQICDTFVQDVAQGVVRRVLRIVRSQRHGGMLVFLPQGSHDDGTADRWLRFRVKFQPDDSTLVYHNLMRQLMARSLDVAKTMQLALLTWNDYQQFRDAELRRIDDRLIEFGHLLASMMCVDGALVLDHSFRLIGFGGEILGDKPVQEIHRALDIEAHRSTLERADSAGTRHRSAYRLVEGLNRAIAVVVSQDGEARFVAHQNDKLTYWPYLP
ncbi:putative sensor domain DACNV-containing protein [Aporhodopirellula aestuarii]|uniref:Diadenylate cyclase n=1 Tax=Aporhodopirellula aestuarii TaxID=2950107 RepID=A0ABT0TYE8_9BACT|nr:diadenylate cyclase [Aporhodopirellula aestuarii]MCM2369506.1 diadenylate cyclase [Aporhodopirellula aestuarii]